MMKNSDFIVFILTHGRPNNVVTFNSLKRSGYTGRIVFILDNEDTTSQQYIENYGHENIYIFDKLAVSKKIDIADNFDGRTAIIYARNACYDIAKELGYKYFLQLDDDYLQFAYKFNSMYDYYEKQIKPDNGGLDRIFDEVLDYYKSINAKCIALAQNGDFIGGAESASSVVQLKRKCMNTFFCSTDRPVVFRGRMNEDVTTYTYTQSQGDLFFTTTQIAIHQVQTQKGDGGMSDVYKESGTYLKTFYSILFHPSSIKIRLMGSKHRRIHHSVSWKYTVPVIIHEKYKKNK